MTPLAFIQKWKAVQLKERSAAQEHFLDLCRLLEERTPADADPLGEWYCFERGASKFTGGDGWADVWKRGCFGWEYKGKHKDLKAAYVQLQQYAVALENPPLLVVCDLDRFRIHTNWTNTVQVIHEITLDDLHEPEKRQYLKWAFSLHFAHFYGGLSETVQSLVYTCEENPNSSRMRTCRGLRTVKYR